MIIFKKLLLTIILIFITTFAFAEDKGYKVAYDPMTGEILEMAYGDSGMEHRPNVIVVPSKDAPKGELKDYKYENGKVVKKPQIEIDARKTKEARIEKEKRIVDLENKKDMAKKKGFIELEAEYQKQIDEL